MSVIKLSHIVKTYDSPTGAVQALKGIDLTIERGEIFGIIGFSGAGAAVIPRASNIRLSPLSPRLNGRRESTPPTAGNDLPADARMI